MKKINKSFALEKGAFIAYSYNMTADKINNYNKILDEVYHKMVASGYDEQSLKRYYVAFTIISLTDDADVYSMILSKLRVMNEKRENYEICSYINKYETELSEVE